jgi:cytochrome P450
LDPSFLTDVLAHLRIFLLAGFDTTSYVLCVIFWLLQQNPNSLAKVRAEHDGVFGSDAALAAQRVKDDPTLLNQLPYTSAVIKEAMRVQPVTGTVRGGEPGFELTNPASHRPMPSEGFVLYSSPHALHHHPSLWPRRLEFLPERWLVPDGHELHPVKNAWRPFEMGPRNCIGQELVQTELRAVMALTLREFDIEPQYDPDGPNIFGDLAYQVPAEVTTRPKGGLPVKIVRRDTT